MTSSTPQAMHVLVAAMPDGIDWPRLLAGDRGMLRVGIRNAPRIPESIIDLAFARRDERLLGDITANNAFLAGRPELRARLAATGSRQVAANWLSSVMKDAWTPMERRELFANADPRDDAWRGSMRNWLDHHIHSTHVRTVVTCRAPGWAGHILSTMGRELSVAEQLRALMSIIDGEGRDAVNRYVDTDTLWPQAAAASADPDTLPGLTERLEGFEGLIPELSSDTLRYPAYHLTLREKVDWDAIIAAHTESPFPKASVLALAARPDCPDDALVALYSTGPTGNKATELLTKAMHARNNASWALTQARPYAAVLKTVHIDHGAARAARDSGFRTRLQVLVGDALGTDVNAWRALRAGMSAFNGSVADLLATAPSWTAPPGATWPKGADLPEPGKRRVMRPDYAAFLALLDVAPEGAHAALLPHIDDRTAFDLFTTCAHRPEWAEYVRVHGTREQAVALAATRKAPSEDIWWLTGLGDPRITALLLDRDATLRPRDAIGCADKQLQRRILHHRPLRGEIPLLRLLLNHWERHGTASVRTLVGLGHLSHGLKVFTAPVKKRMERLLAGDEATGLRKLREYVERGESPEGQIALLRRKGRTDAFGEHHDWHWDALVAEHRREPFPPGVLRGMAHTEGCPESLRLEGGQVRPEPPDVPWDLTRSAGRGVVTRAINNGTTVWGHVLAHASPAWRALAMLADAEPGPGRDEGVAVAATMVGGMIGADTDAWTVALAMLPDFTGTLPELLRTASATVN